MLSILDSVKKVVDGLKYVKIQKAKIEEFAKDITDKDLRVNDVSLGDYDWDIEQMISLSCTFNVINYCFWAKKGKEK